MSLHLTGIHHLTAITADIAANKQFYTETMGMRLVKKTVNQDDVSAYHLFYADSAGTAGTDVTFFDWPAKPEKRGTNSITRTSLRILNESSLEYWTDRFLNAGVMHSDPFEQDGRFQIAFEDLEGQRLALVVDSQPVLKGVEWEKSDVPVEHQIIGLGPIELSVNRAEQTQPILQELMGMKMVREYRSVESPESPTYVFQMGEGGAHAEIHLTVRGDILPGRTGAGGVHHVALRTPSEEEYHRWAQRLESNGVPNSGPVNRYYFQSLYFREPNGILFEIATDGPGFAVDEDASTLGERLALPPFLEHRREDIEARLKPIK